MYIDNFKLEDWLALKHENIQYDIAQTSEDAITLWELLQIGGISREEFLDGMLNMRLNYGYTFGNPDLRSSIAKLYKTIDSNDIVTTHGGIGANHIIIQSLLGPGDHVITLMPAYQQLYAIPESTGAEVSEYFLTLENKYEINISDVEYLIKENTKVLLINNPNNPTGLLIPEDKLMELVELAKKYDLYILSDEAYRHLNQGNIYSSSIADLYDNGISISTVSKICSIPGVRIGWFATKNEEIRDFALRHREYSTVSCSLVDEYIANLSLGIMDKIVSRNISTVAKNLETMDEIIGRNKKLSYIRPVGGTTALVYYKHELDSFEFAKTLLREKGVYVVPGDTFEIPNSFRVGTTVHPETFREAFLKIEEFIK